MICVSCYYFATQLGSTHENGAPPQGSTPRDCPGRVPKSSAYRGRAEVISGRLERRYARPEFGGDRGHVYKAGGDFLGFSGSRFRGLNNFGAVGLPLFGGPALSRCGLSGIGFSGAAPGRLWRDKPIADAVRDDASAASSRTSRKA